MLQQRVIVINSLNPHDKTPVLFVIIVNSFLMSEVNEKILIIRVSFHYYYTNKDPSSYIYYSSTGRNA